MIIKNILVTLTDNLVYRNIIDLHQPRSLCPPIYLPQWGRGTTAVVDEGK